MAAAATSFPIFAPRLPAAALISSAAAVLASTVAFTLVPNSSGKCSASDIATMPPMLWPSSATGAPGAISSRTAFRSPAMASSE
jgi:hypothetical protein